MPRTPRVRPVARVSLPINKAAHVSVGARKVARSFQGPGVMLASLGSFNLLGGRLQYPSVLIRANLGCDERCARDSRAARVSWCAPHQGREDTLRLPRKPYGPPRPPQTRFSG